VLGYLLLAPIVLVGAGSAVAAAAGRSFGAGLRASVWAIVLGGPLVIAAWLAEAPNWARQLDRLLIDGKAATARTQAAWATAICCGVTVTGPGAAMSTSCWRSRACVRSWTPQA
jgi:hypothetical protein